MTYLVQPKKYAIFVLGAGGTGSWLCAFLDKMSLYNDVIVMDGDVVEAKTHFDKTSNITILTKIRLKS